MADIPHGTDYRAQFYDAIVTGEAVFIDLVRWPYVSMRMPRVQQFALNHGPGRARAEVCWTDSWQGVIELLYLKESTLQE